MEEEPLLGEDLVLPLWSAYRKTPDYKSGKNRAISRNHPLILSAESEGLKRIFKNFIDNLREGKFRREEIKRRKPSDWLTEWKSMHKMLFDYVLKDRGYWRKSSVRFGDSGDEDLHRIPHESKVQNHMNHLAEYVVSFCKQDYSNEPDKLFPELAKIHYEFIRIHPFRDGNGRIARAVIDQLAILNGFPPAMGGYPRFNEKRRKDYHKAIRNCVDDRECGELAMWIRNYFEHQMKTLA